MTSRTNNPPEADDLIEVIRRRKAGYDQQIDAMAPDAKTLASALCRFPPEGGRHTEEEIERKAYAYLQARAYVQANVEHAEAMSGLAQQLQKARFVGWVLSGVGLLLAGVDVAVALIEAA